VTQSLALEGRRGDTRGEIRFVDMDRPGALGRLFNFARVAHNRLVQMFTRWLMHRLLVRVEIGPQAVSVELDRWRAHIASERPPRAHSMSIDAVKVARPHDVLHSPPVPSDWFAPIRGEPHGFVFYVHGGSFILERSPAITDVVAQFSAAAGARVYAPNYRLAPEHPCPAAVDDIVEAWAWFRDTWPDEPVVALAESAGSSILLAALQRIAAAGDELPSGVVLLSPWVDLSLQSWSVLANSLSGASGSTMESLAMMAHLYLGGRPASDPVASPLYGDFTGFPPMLIHASKTDILYDDAVRLADRVRDAGGDLTVRLWTDEIHVWERAATPKAMQSIELGAEFIRRRLG